MDTVVKPENDKSLDRIHELEEKVKTILKPISGVQNMSCEFTWNGTKDVGHLGWSSWLSEQYSELDNGRELDESLTDTLTELFELVIKRSGKRVILAQLNDGTVSLQYQ